MEFWNKERRRAEHVLAPDNAFPQSKVEQTVQNHVFLFIPIGGDPFVALKHDGKVYSERVKRGRVTRTDTRSTDR